MEAIQPSLDEKRQEIRLKVIDWQARADSGIIDSTLAERLSLFSESKFSENPELWLTTVLTALNQISNIDDIQYLLTVLDDSFQTNPESAMLLKNSSSSFQILQRHLSREDLYIRSRCCSIYVTFFKSFLNEEIPLVIFDPFFNFIKVSMKKTSNNEENILVFLHTLRKLLNNHKIRGLFVEGQGLDILTPLLVLPHSSLQLLYETLFNIWLCSFTTSAVDIFSTPSSSSSSSSAASSSSSSLAPEQRLLQILLQPALNLLPAIVNILKSQQKDKIIRVSLAIIKNILSTKAPPVHTTFSLAAVSSSSSSSSSPVICSSTHAGKQLIELGCIKVLHNLLTKQWRDEELKADLNTVSELLDKKEDELSSIDAYINEIDTGRLYWSPPHLSEKFWRENFTRFEAENYKLVRTLGVLLQSKDATTLAVACHDIGNFAIFHPRGRGIVDQYDIKNIVLSLMSSDDPAVQRESLLCVQKLLTTKWGTLSHISSGGSGSGGGGAGQSQAQTAAGGGSSTSSALKNPLQSSVPK